MTCPNCTQPMTKERAGEMLVDHCPTCGGTYFDINEINRIPLADAERLAADKKSDEILAGEKYCPRDAAMLETVRRESVPQHVTLLECPKCKGVFAFPEDLINFKQAQEARVAYLRTWRIPMPALSTILVFGLLIATISVVYRLDQQQGVPIRAVQEICTPQVTHGQDASIVYCRTARSYSSDAVFVNTQTGEEVAREVNPETSDVHVLTVLHSDIPPSPDICVKLVLRVDEQRVETDCVNYYDDHDQD